MACCCRCCLSVQQYTENNTEYPLDLNLYQIYFPIERYGVGLCPMGCGHPQPSEHCVGQRIAAAVQYGATELDLCVDGAGFVF